MIKAVLNRQHLDDALGEAVGASRHRLFIATADLKDVHLPCGRGRARPLLEVLGELGERGVEVRVLHSSIPSGPLLERLRDGVPGGVTFRRCIRNHAKAVLVDGRWMYLGSANLTGAGLGAKGPARRNFEAGICTDRLELIDPVADMLNEIWTGSLCEECGRRDHCAAPLEEPNL